MGVRQFHVEMYATIDSDSDILLSATQWH